MSSQCYYVHSSNKINVNIAFWSLFFTFAYASAKTSHQFTFKRHPVKWIFGVHCSLNWNWNLYRIAFSSERERVCVCAFQSKHYSFSINHFKLKPTIEWIIIANHIYINSSYFWLLFSFSLILIYVLVITLLNSLIKIKYIRNV